MTNPQHSETERLDHGPNWLKHTEDGLLLGECRLILVSHMEFLKLDTKVIRNFDNALAGEVEILATSTFSVLKRIRARSGWIRTFRAVNCAMFGRNQDAFQLVKGNVARKRIRLPMIFGNVVSSKIYEWIKALQTSILLDDLNAHAKNHEQQNCHHLQRFKLSRICSGPRCENTELGNGVCRSRFLSGNAAN